MVAVQAQLSAAAQFQNLGYTPAFIMRWTQAHGPALTESAPVFGDGFFELGAGAPTRSLPPILPVLAPSTEFALFPAMFAPNRARRIRGAGRLCALLKAQPFVRQELEMALGGRCVRAEGNQLQLERFLPGLTLANGAPAAMNRALESMASFTFALGNLNVGVAVGSFASVFGSVCAHGFGKIAEACQRNNGGYGYSRNSHCCVSDVLRDPSLTMEDKVVLMIMLIMKEMDKEIERQAQYINQIQQQASKGGKKGKGGFMGIGGGGGGGGGGSSPSIDVETMKLKRLIDKRGQMFDMLRQIIDKYNETAKNIIQSMGR